MDPLRPFQTRFIDNALAPGVDTACLSLPRGNGKSWLAGYLAARVLTPTDGLFQVGKESVLLAASIEQSRIVYKFVRDELEPTGEYRFLDSATRIGITHKATNTRLRVISSSGKSAMGLVNTPLAIADEPGSWQTVGGELMFDALMTAQGKPKSPLKIIIIGTLAPASDGWWPQMITRGSHGSTFVQALQGDVEKWDQWSEIKRCNPLTAISKEFRKKLLEERDEARKDSRLKARFLSYRLNCPTADESSTLLSVEDWKLMLTRPVPERRGSPIVGIDLGGGRAWSSAVAVYRNGRSECFALAPGVPSIRDQEKRDRVPQGLYGRLVASGQLIVCEGLHVPPVGRLVKHLRARWGAPRSIICDRFRLGELEDVVNFCPVVSRVTRWSEASEDIRALRRGVKDGPLAVSEDSRSLLLASLSVSKVENDSAGNSRLVKKGSNNESRDDVAQSWTLAAGARDRLPPPRQAPRHFTLE